MAVLGLLAGCSTATQDTFVPPQTGLPPVYGGAAAAAGAEGHAGAPWWSMFNDPLLDDLQRRVAARNPELVAAAQRLVQAQAQWQATAAGHRPTVTAGAGAEHLRTSAQTPQALALGGRSVSGELYAVRADLSYEWDVWGRIGRLSEAAAARASQAEADMHGVRLLLQTRLAQAYWRWRGTGAEIGVFEKAVLAREQACELAQTRLGRGLTGELDLRRAETELVNARAELRELRRQHLNALHDLQALTGDWEAPAAGAAAPALPAVPTVAAGVPADLLGRRPDLVASVQELRAAHAQVGAAEAALYPSISITSNFGFASDDLRRLVRGDARQFEIGPFAISVPLLDGGRLRAGLALAQARRAEALAQHEGRLLGALREVENALSDREQHMLAAQDMDLAVVATGRAAAVAQVRYERGLSSYLEVIDAQRSALAAERQAVHLRFELLLDSVALVRALGGGWSEWETGQQDMPQGRGGRHEQ